MKIYLRDYNPDNSGEKDSGKAFRGALEYIKNLT